MEAATLPPVVDELVDEEELHTLDEERGLRGGVIEIDPNRAYMMLERNQLNRKIRDGHVDWLASQIREDNWKLNGESIKFDGEGYLLDGQHRLHAVDQAGKPIKSLVVVGIDPVSRHTVDTGAHRSAADVLQMHGFDHAYVLAPALRVYYYEKGPGLSAYNRHRHAPANQEILELAEENPEMHQRYTEINQSGILRIMTQTVACYSYWRFCQLDEELAQAYASKVAYGVDLDKGEPFWLLREKLFDLAQEEGKNRTKDQLFAVLTAWNAAREGDPLTMTDLDFRQDRTIPNPV